jgi:hypothetical protein
MSLMMAQEVANRDLLCPVWVVVDESAQANPQGGNRTDAVAYLASF